MPGFLGFEIAGHKITLSSYRNRHGMGIAQMSQIYAPGLLLRYVAAKVKHPAAKPGVS